MNITTKEDLDFLVSSIVQNPKIENKEELFLLIREKVLEILISKGDVIPSEYLKLFFVFKDIKAKPHPQYTKHIEFFKKHYFSATIEERYLINNFLFGLEILNGNFNSIKDYIKRGLLFNAYDLAENKEGDAFLRFFKNEIDEEIVIESFKELIEPRYFFTLNDKEKRAVFATGLAILWNIPNMFNNQIWLNVFDDLVNLLNETIKRKLIEEQMYIHFFTYHIYGNNIQTIDKWRVFNERVEKPASRFYKEWKKEHALKKAKETISKDKKKVAFLIDRITFNSPWMVTYSLFKTLIDNKEFSKDYEIYVYSMNYVEKQLEDKKLINDLTKLGIKFFTPNDLFIDQGFYYPHIKKALLLRNTIIEDGIDYLIGGGGYDISIFLFATRSAPKQMFWSHGNCVSDFEGVDERISHFSQECKEWEWKIFNVPLDKKFLIGTEEDRQKGETLKATFLETYGKDTVMLGTIGRYIKIDNDEYIKTVAKIMKQNKNTIYLACGAGDKESIRQRVKKYKIPENRFIFAGLVEPHVYGWVIDVYLDSFPLQGGNAVEEIKAKGKAIVRLHNGEKGHIYEVIWIRETVYKENGGIEKFINIEANEENIEKLRKITINKSLLNYFLENRFLFVRSPVVNIERYIELANLFIQNKKLKEEGLRLDICALMKNSAVWQSDISAFLRALDG
jgi:hypothetical protein